MDHNIVFEVVNNYLLTWPGDYSAKPCEEAVLGEPNCIFSNYKSWYVSFDTKEQMQEFKNKYGAYMYPVGLKRPERITNVPILWIPIQSKRKKN